MKSNDGALTRIVMHFTYKEEIYLANIIQTLDSEFSSDFCMGYGVMTSRFLTTVGTYNND